MEQQDKIPVPNGSMICDETPKHYKCPKCNYPSSFQSPCPICYVDRGETVEMEPAEERRSEQLPAQYVKFDRMN